MSDNYNDAPYGYCPLCGAKGVSTERRINGLTTCENGHVRPRANFTNPTGKEQVEIEVGKGAKVGNITINKESKMFLSNLEESINLQKLDGATALTVKSAFFANYVTALVFLKIQDLKGLMLINDHAHTNLSKFTSGISDLNFWGRSLFHSNVAEIKNRMKPDEAAVLAKSSARVSTSRIQKIMKVAVTSPDAIDWKETISGALLLQHVFSFNSSYFNSILRTLIKWDIASINAKQKVVNDALMFLLQSDQSSKLITNLRSLSNLVNYFTTKPSSKKVVGFMKLREDDVGGDATSTSAVASTNAILNPSGPSINSQSGHPDTSQDMQNVLGGLYRLRKMAPNQITKKGRFTIRNGKMVTKRVKSFSPKKFKAPDFLKPTKKESKEIENVV